MENKQRIISIENKKKFISLIETALILYSREKIKSIRYEKENESEFAVVCYCNGYEKRIDITADSCAMIMGDISRGLVL